MLIGTLLYAGELFYCVVDARFGENRFYVKPATVKAAMLAEGIVGTAFEAQEDKFKDDFARCRYRLDISTSVKVNTTMLNKQLVAEFAVALSAGIVKVKQAHSENAGGTYQEVWGAHTTFDGVEAHLMFDKGLLSSGWVKTEKLQLKLRADEVPYPTDDVFDCPDALTNMAKECKDTPKFGSLSGKFGMYTQLYSIVKDYATRDDAFKELLPKKQGALVIQLTSKQGENLPGAAAIKCRVADAEQEAAGIYETIEQVKEAHPDKNTAWIEDCHYKIVTDEMLDGVMRELWAAPYISFDTETTGLSINFYSREGTADELVGVCLSPEEGKGYYFPLQHKKFKNLCNGDHNLFMQKYMKTLLEKKKVICHNLSYDWKVAYIYDINVNCVFDTMLAFGVTKRYEYVNYPTGLKDLCTELFGIDMFEISDFIMTDWAKSNITFADLPHDLVEHYGPADADITLRLYNWCKKERLLEKYEAERVFRLEVDFAKVVSYSEFWGYHIDIAKLPELEEEIMAGMEREKKKMFDIAGREFNPNSSGQLAQIMYDELGIPVVGEKRSTSKDILKELGEYQNLDGTPMYPFVNHLLSYRKFEGTYKNFLKKKDQFISPEGFVFPKVYQLGTNTGRLSIHEPNYQSYNDVVKKNVTGRPGYYIYDCDFAQVEYRVLASMAGESALIKAFDDPDLDYHQHQAARMFSLPYAAVTKQLRQQSKGINFGLPYGMGDESLGKRVFGAKTPENTAKAADLRKRFFDGQDNILNFFETVRADGVKKGYTSTWLGRRRYYHKALFSEAAIRRQAGNHVIQGSAADIWKTSVVRFFNRVVKEGWLGKVLFCGFIHDELMGEVSVELNPYEFIKAWREEYELAIEDFCKLFAGFGWGRSWYEAKKADYPPYFIDSLCNKAGTPEAAEWDGDYVKLIEKTKAEMYDYETNRVTAWLQESPRGTLLAPHIGNYLYAKVTDWWPSIEEKHPELTGKKLKSLSLDEVWHLFAEHEGIEYEDGWILPSDAVKTEAKKVEMAEAEDELATAEAQLEETRKSYAKHIVEQVKQLNFCVDTYLEPNEMVVYLKFISQEHAISIGQASGVPADKADIKVRFIQYFADGTYQILNSAFGFTNDNFGTAQLVCQKAYLTNKG